MVGNAGPAQVVLPHNTRIWRAAGPQSRRKLHSSCKISPMYPYRSALFNVDNPETTKQADQLLQPHSRQRQNEMTGNDDKRMFQDEHA